MNILDAFAADYLDRLALKEDSQSAAEIEQAEADGWRFHSYRFDGKDKVFIFVKP